MKTTKLVLSLFAVLLSLTSAHGQIVGVDGGNRPLTPEQFAALTADIVEMIECEDCTANVMERVVKWGPRAVPTLAAILIGGVSDMRKEEFRRALRHGYSDLSAYYHARGSRARLPTEAEYLEIYLSNYDALYRTRALEALRSIGGPDSEAAIKMARTNKKLPLKLRTELERQPASK